MRRVVLFLAAVAASGAVFTAKLQDHTIAAWDKYVEQAEARMATKRPLLDLDGETPKLVDLHPNGDENVRDGYIHHWVGAVRIPNITVAAIRDALNDYEHYPAIYAPDVKLASATKAGDNLYDVRLVTERVEGLGLHFAFDIQSRVRFVTQDGESKVESRSYSIRESNRGKAPYTDLLPEGKDHGILWRLNSYWRLRQAGTSVYAECEVISLSRKPLIGMDDLVKNRARTSLEMTLRQTRDRVLGRTP